MSFISVKESEQSLESVQLPLDQNRLTAITLERNFPGACGLMYRINDQLIGVGVASGDNIMREPFFKEPIDGWTGKIFFTIKNAAPQPTNPLHNIQDSVSKELIECCRKYMLYSLMTNIEGGEVTEGNIKNCVTVASSELAFMAAHCLPKSCAFGDKFTVYDKAGNSYPVQILHLDRVEQDGDDFVILKITDGKFPHYPSSMSLPGSGHPYFILGYDSEYTVDDLSCFYGRFRNTKLGFHQNYVIGTPGTTSGCSGGGVFDYNGSLYGICTSGRMHYTSNFIPLYDHLHNSHIRPSEPSYSHIIPGYYICANLSPAQKMKLEGGRRKDNWCSKQYKEAP